jgi:hypothetical protein
LSITTAKPARYEPFMQRAMRPHQRPTNCRADRQFGGGKWLVWWSNGQEPGTRRLRVPILSSVFGGAWRIRTADTLACQAKSPISWRVALCCLNVNAAAAGCGMSPGFAEIAVETAVRSQPFCGGGPSAGAAFGSWARCFRNPQPIALPAPHW